MDKQLIKNIVSLFGVQGMNYLIPLITLPYLVKTLGPESYGVLGFSMAFIQYFIMLTDYGFNLSATRDVAINRENITEVSRIFWSVMICKAIMLIISLFTLFAICQISDYISQQQMVVWSSFGMVLGNVLFPIWLFQGKEEIALSSATNICARLFSVPLIFFLVKTPADAWISALITSITAIVGGLTSLCIVYKRNFICISRVTVQDVLVQYREGWHVFISGAAVSLYTTTVTVILGFVCGPVSVGYFVAADKLRQAAQGLINPISQAMYPRMSALMSTDLDKGYVLLRRVFRYYTFLGLLLCGILLFASKLIIHEIYGMAYTESVVVLMILSACIPFVAMSRVLGEQTLLALGFKKEFSSTLIMSGLCSVTILFPSVYFFSQNGAALSVLIAEIIVVTLMAFYVIKNKLPVFKSN